MQLRKNGEAGFTLLSALVSVALLGLVIVLTTGGWHSVASARTTVEGRRYGRQVEGAFATSMIQQLRSHVTAASCWNPTSQLNNVGVSNFGTLSYSNAIKLDPGVQDEAQRAAATRCRAPSLPSGNGPYRNAHFCVAIQPAAVAGQPKQSFFAATYAFAEIRVDLMDMGSSAPVPCAAFATQQNAGGVLAYQIFWGKRDADGRINAFHTGSVSYFGK